MEYARIVVKHNGQVMAEGELRAFVMSFYWQRPFAFFLFPTTPRLLKFTRLQAHIWKRCYAPRINRMTTTIKLEITEETLRELVVKYISDMMGDVEILPDDVSIMVKSKQNYCSEWEKAEFKATVCKFVP